MERVRQGCLKNLLVTSYACHVVITQFLNKPVISANQVTIEQKIDYTKAPHIVPVSPYFDFTMK